MRSRRSLLPLRGSTEDWGPGKYQRNLEHKAEYSRRMQKQVEEGAPDFEKLLSTGVSPPSAVPARKAGKAKKKTTPPAKRKAPSAPKKARRK